MTVWEILLIGIALSMDAFAVGMTNGMTEPKMRTGKIFCVAGAFALFQFLMPVLGYYCGYAFSSLVEKVAPFLAFFLLAVIGGKMIADFLVDLHRESKKGKETAGKTENAEKNGESGAATKLLGAEKNGESGLAAKPLGTEKNDESGAATKLLGTEKNGESSAAAKLLGAEKNGESNAAAKPLGAVKLLAQALATSIDALAVGVTLLAADTKGGLPFPVVFCALSIGAVTFCLSFCAVILGKKIGNRFSAGAGLLGGVILLAIGFKILLESFL